MTRKGFDRNAAFVKTRKEIERHARYVGAAETDDLSRWLVAWCWFMWRPTDLEKITDKMIQTVTVSAAHRMGCRDLSEDDALVILEEARDYQRHMKADDLAYWLGCTWADRCACSLTRIGACDKTREERRALAKERKRLAREAKRRRKGAVPKHKWLAKTVTAEARRKRVHRSTIYRRRKRQMMQQSVRRDATGRSLAEELLCTARDSPVASKKGATEQKLIPWRTPRLYSEGVGTA